MFRAKKYCPAVFLDVAQAFDKVWHESLMYKIKRILPVNTNKILQSYLKERKFRIKCNEYFEYNKYVRDYDILAGVPQGSVLGPTLYYLPTSEEVLTSTFADDTAILSSLHNSIIASVELNKHLKYMEIWFSMCFKWLFSSTDVMMGLR